MPILIATNNKFKIIKQNAKYKIKNNNEKKTKIADQYFLKIKCDFR